MSAPTSPEAAVQDSPQPIVDICVVDDDVATVEMLCETLTNCGYRCFGTTDLYERVLDLCSGNRVRAPQMLGIGRTSLYRYLKREHRVRPAAGSPTA